MARVTRRRALGTAILGAGVVAARLGFRAGADTLRARGRLHLGGFSQVSDGLRTAARFPLVEALQGRRSRRFARAARIPHGPLTYASAEDPNRLLQQPALKQEHRTQWVPHVIGKPRKRGRAVEALP